MLRPVQIETRAVTIFDLTLYHTIPSFDDPETESF